MGLEDAQRAPEVGDHALEGWEAIGGLPGGGRRLGLLSARRTRLDVNQVNIAHE